MRPTSPLPKRSSEKAAALIIVLAFVVLLTGLAVAYLSRATTDRQLAHTSFHDTDANVLARSALDTVIGDLKQEIVNGSNSFSLTGTPLFVPKSNANMVPMRNNAEPTIPNLIRRSLRSETALWPDSVLGPAVGSRASAVNSTSDVSANNRSVTLAKWNSHYMVPKLHTTDGGSDPITTGYSAPSYWAPDWVIVTRAGPNPSPSPPGTPFPVWNSILADASANNNNYAVGRYAYAIYDEGGLLDMNAAGYPSPTTILQYGRKGSLAFSDLTSLPGFSTTTVDNFVGLRDYASSQPSGTLNPPSSNLSFTPTAANTYYNFILSDPVNIQLTNYLTDLPLTYFTNSFLTPSGAITPSPSPGATPTPPSRTDHLLLARQELIDLRYGVNSGGISFSNALQSLGTFSREASANVPQWTGPSPTPTSTNPNFQTLLVTSSFTRNDGTTANINDPYLNKRFLLQRLNWLTYRGPSANRTIPASAPALGDTNYDMWLLTRGAAVAEMNSIRFGLTSAFLQQGTPANIQKYFGLAWDSTNERWNYVGQGGSLLSSIATLNTLTGTREPDFFELLQAGIVDGSIGDSLSTDPALPWPLTSQQSKWLHILTIGANLVAQSRADSYPVRIAFNVGGTTMEAVGMPRLPCLNSLAVCPVGVAVGQDGGGMHWFLIPNLWDPFRDTWDLTEANANNNLSTPGYLRPPVRITVTGNATGSVDFGYVAPGSPSGSVNPASVTTFNRTLTISPAKSLPLATGNVTFGRDGLLEAKRLGASDISGSVTSFPPTNQPEGDGFDWNDIVRPANDTSTYRTDDFIAFRISFSGADITGSYEGQNPVLVLKSGFQVSLDYQSPNGQWYSYSFLQGNNASNTWITSANGLCLATSFSQYHKFGSFSQATIVDSLNQSNPSLWNDLTGALKNSPMFAKADPRNPRYSSRIGVVNLGNPPLPWASAGILGPIWPSQYAITPAPITASGYPIPTPTGTIIPGTLGDNAAAGNGANPYNELVPTPTPTPPTPNVSIGDNWRPVMMNRPFRSVGEMAYVFRDQPFRTLSFSSANSPDAGLLDLFTTNDYTIPSPTPTPTATPITTATPVMRAGVISLNSRQAPALASLLAGTIRREDTPRSGDAPPGPSPFPMDAATANSVSTSLTSWTINNPLINRADLATLIANTNPVGFDATVPKTQRESMARAFGETVQTRTWNLLIDIIAQTGHYKPNATSFADFVVEGEQRYWAHVAIDRFTGQVIDTKVEAVKE